MVRLYVSRILAGRMTADEVPERWREAVDAAMVAHYAGEVLSGAMSFDGVPERWRDAVKEALGE
jgi:hypothetical protein